MLSLGNGFGSVLKLFCCIVALLDLPFDELLNLEVDFSAAFFGSCVLWLEGKHTRTRANLGYSGN